MTADRPKTGVAIIGSTGSIGTQTLDVLHHLADSFTVVALAAGMNQSLLAEQALSFLPQLVVTQDPPDPLITFPDSVETGYGPQGLVQVATHPAAEIVVVASAGHAAIEPTLAAINAGKTIALANKEVIVCAGELIMAAARQAGVSIRPIDSEHSAIWQSLDGGRSRIKRLILTASGGPFRTLQLHQLPNVSVEQALGHPTWQMGQKITIDSATMMNKGLELIEAHWLFDVDYDHLDVLIHPESIVHSIVEYEDASQLAQMSLPDMRLPIQFALTYPRHVSGLSQPLRLEEIGMLSFEAVEAARYPALNLAREAGRSGGAYPTVLSAADDVAVTAFLNGRISFTDIIDVVDETLNCHAGSASNAVEAIIGVDRDTRIAADEIVRKVSARIR
ncbi:1-deoxy-D-xylulose-5-phosphate reductoisomerase [soil metagenome]